INAELVAFETKEEMDAVAEYVSDTFVWGYWTSGNDYATTGKHVWFSNAQPILSDLWYYTEPNNLGGNERCVVLVYKKPVDLQNLTGLYDVGCRARQSRYICEAPQPKTASFIVN
ncbi:hypothetical protein KR026_008334, partial [Drosophila bipectinata]